jgi:Spy/CpxP family protein refolding chaperone
VNYIDHAQPADSRRPASEPNPPSPAENRDRDDRERQRPPEIPPPRLAKELSRQFVQQLNETLKLTREQREKIAKIVADGQERNREIWTNVAPQMRQVMQDIHQQIRGQLTAEQQKKYEELMKKHAPHHLPPSKNAPPDSPSPTNAAPLAPAA